MAYANNYENVWCPAKPQSSFPNYYYIIEVAVREESWDVSTNKSRLYLEADITGHQINFEGNQAQTLAVYWHDDKNGTIQVASNSYTSISQNEVKQITGYIDVPHNDDGTLSGYAFTEWIKNGSNSFVPPTTYVSANLTLTTIPRKSVPSVSGTTNIGNTVTINTNRKSNSFTHTLSYSFGSLTNRQIATNVGASINWLIPTDFYAQIPNATSGTMALTCTTYNGSTPVGTETINVTVYVNTNTAKPSLANPTFSIDSTTNAKTGVTNKYINNYSTMSISATASHNYGSKIKYIRLIGVKNGQQETIETKTYTGNNSSETANFSSLSKKTYSSYKVNTTDTRGQTTVKDVGVTTIAYVAVTADSAPSITRTSGTGSVAKITSYRGNFWNGNFGAVSNSLTIQWRYKEVGGSYSSYYTIPANSIWYGTNNDYGISNYTFTVNGSSNLFDYTKLYDIDFKVTDSLQQATQTSTYRLSRGVPNFVIFQNKSLVNGFDVVTNQAKNIIRNAYYLNHASVTATLKFPAKQYKHFVVTIYSRFDNVKELQMEVNSTSDAVTYRITPPTISNVTLSISGLNLIVTSANWNILMFEIASISTDTSATEVTATFG